MSDPYLNSVCEAGQCDHSANWSGEEGYVAFVMDVCVGLGLVPAEEIL